MLYFIHIANIIDPAKRRCVDPTRTDPPDVSSIDTHKRTLPRALNHEIIVESTKVLNQNESLQYALHSAINFKKIFDKKYL